LTGHCATGSEPVRLLGGANMDEERDQTDRSFDQRLQEARNRQGLDPVAPAGKQADQDASSMAVFFRVGVELVSALLVGLAIGWGLDRLLHTRPLFLIVFVLLGGVAGIINVWRLVAPAPKPGRKS
jgi:ATP synthase protein I